jgi:ketosteroid isomerase-like protein
MNARIENRDPVAARVDAATLEAFAAAWNRHDADALMAFMTDDCEFRSSAGPDACGTLSVGRDAVRAAYARVWADFPDAQWVDGRHLVAGDRGLSEWIFKGTRAADGVRVEVDGCDLFTFAGGRIRVKDSYRKQRVA